VNVLEAVQRRGNPIVEFPEIPAGVSPVQIDGTVVGRKLATQLGA